jgi:hypothetical protein
MRNEKHHLHRTTLLYCQRHETTVATRSEEHSRLRSNVVPARRVYWSFLFPDSFDEGNPKEPGRHFRHTERAPWNRFRDQEQVQLAEVFAREYYRDQPFREQRSDALTYFFRNEAFCHSDAIMLHCMLRHFKPRKLIEIGSGFSSCVTLDTNRLFLDNSIECVFIDKYSEVLKTLRAGTVDGLNIVAKRARMSRSTFFVSCVTEMFYSSTRVTLRRWAATSTTFSSTSFQRSALAFGCIFTMCFIRSSTRKTGCSTVDRGVKHTCSALSYNSMQRLKSSCFLTTWSTSTKPSSSSTCHCA